MTANKNAALNAALLQCPPFLLEMAAIELDLPLSTLKDWIKSKNEAGIEKIEVTILQLGRLAEYVQLERQISKEGGGS